MLFGRFLHPALAPRPEGPADEDTEAVRRIVAQLESLPPEQAARLAGFACILARVVAADTSADPAEVHELEALVADFGAVSTRSGAGTPTDWPWCATRERPPGAAAIPSARAVPRAVVPTRRRAGWPRAGRRP